MQVYRASIKGKLVKNGNTVNMNFHLFFSTSGEKKKVILIPVTALTGWMDSCDMCYNLRFKKSYYFVSKIKCRIR